MDVGYLVFWELVLLPQLGVMVAGVVLSIVKMEQIRPAGPLALFGFAAMVVGALVDVGTGIWAASWQRLVVSGPTTDRSSRRIRRTHCSMTPSCRSIRPLTC